MIKFPSDTIDPKKKDKDWILQTGKAIWDESKTFSSSIFYHGRDQFRKYRNYSNGRQPIEKYKNMVMPLDANEVRPDNFQQLDYTILPIIPKFKKIALGKIDKIGFNIVATAIDSIARDDEEDYFAEQKAKIKMLEELSDVPNIESMLDLKDDDPRSLEEIKIKQEYSYKHIAAVEAEKGLKQVFTNNKYDQILDRVKADLFDFGVGGVREYFDENNKIKIRHANMENFVCGYSEEPDFSDSHYMCEVKPYSIEEIRASGEFEEDEIEEILKQRGDSNTRFDRRGVRLHNDNKILVLEFEVKSFNEPAYEKRVNSFGNKKINKTEYNKKSNDKRTIVKDGYKVIYKGKWIISTDYVFDYGLCTNMKRSKNQLKETTFSWHLMAPNQDQMNFFGVTEAMVPIGDQIQLAWLKIQNLLLNAVPPGIAFDLSALENLNLGHSGEKWLPRKALEMYRQRGDMPFRSQREDGEPMNTQSIIPIQNNVAVEINNFVNLVNGFMGILRDNIGFNEVTDGSTPDPRTLNGVANLAYQATTNALNHIIQGTKFLNENVADSIVIRLQDAFGAGENAYKKALGINTERFWKVLSNITIHELSLKFEDKPNDEEKAVLNRRMELAEQAGQITVADSTYIDTIDNVKEKAMVLAYLVKKNMADKQAMDMQNIQANAQSQQESAAMTAQMEEKRLELEYGYKSQLQREQNEALFVIERLKSKTRIDEADIKEAGRAFTKQLENEGKQTIKQMESTNDNDKTK